MVDGSGFMTGEKAPGGYICRIDPEGKQWDLVSMGYRNPFDIAFNRNGDLFTYDSDMEWDVNTPWYRPRACYMPPAAATLATAMARASGQPYYIDSLPPVVNVGRVPPRALTFGYGAKFPAKYEQRCTCVTGATASCTLCT